MQNAVIPTILEELRFLWILAAFVLLMIPHTVDADQKNPELDQLFLQLKHSTSPSQATSLEKRIWQIWMEHPLPAITTKLRKGAQAMQLKNYEEALKHFSELTRQVPQFAEGWNKRATVLFLMGRFHESSVDVERTLQLEPRHFGALSGKGLILMNLKDWSGAIEAFQQGLQIHPFMPSTKKHLKFVIEKHKESII